jgi:hypothetical protein
MTTEPIREPIRKSLSFALALILTATVNAQSPQDMTVPQIQLSASINKSQFVVMGSKGEILLQCDEDWKCVLTEGHTWEEVMRIVLTDMKESSAQQSSSCEREKKLILDAWKRSNDRMLKIVRPKESSSPKQAREEKQ